ncbi:hypothetical protein M3650_05775 [Paenibacillus sp. MER TA 81-3]|uniref:hypothetical protein n=1 Tax=Paenibacillus sp. MER TA 81-3 TaxID=2939573 RepID=UPI00203C248E|nr:hypothetical protein [Paenibacillus sp. MER TA 81-3]MCM3338154.1 hypothetical protein [Paenibacillus sp. MER TA 81-3]
MRKCIGLLFWIHGMPSNGHDAEREGRFFALRAAGRFVTMPPPRMAMPPSTYRQPFQLPP